MPPPTLLLSADIASGLGSAHVTEIRPRSFDLAAAAALASSAPPFGSGWGRFATITPRCFASIDNVSTAVSAQTPSVLWMLGVVHAATRSAAIPQESVREL